MGPPSAAPYSVSWVSCLSFPGAFSAAASCATRNSCNGQTPRHGNRCRRTWSRRRWPRPDLVEFGLVVRSDDLVFADRQLRERIAGAGFLPGHAAEQVALLADAVDVHVDRGRWLRATADRVWRSRRSRTACPAPRPRTPRKLRVSCGIVLICLSEILVPTSEVLTSVSAVPVTTTVSSVDAPAAGAAALPPRSRLTDVATASVTVCSVPGPASTR